ncbi:uncharacterized protein [Amphiura filiformis]|uniref:uncharacterized protein n=1 Tax=Amphiura filiformis TaxID=82378 RepID=UPI003B20BEAC
MPSDISKATDPNQATAVVTWPPPTASDNSGEQIALTSNYNSGEPFGYGIHEVTYTGKDPSNNECSASFNVTITAPGCFVDSNFIPLGESYISTDCTKKCNCTSANNPDCQSNECDDNEVCEERKNIRKCYCKRGFFLDSKDGKCYAAACQASLGIEDGRIPDNKLTASTVWDDYHGPSNARLNRPAEYPTVGSWSAKYNNISQWIQVDLGVLVGVTGVLIQGRAYNVDARLLGGSDCCPQWVTEFKVQHSNDGIDWHYVLSHNNQDAMIFDGNTDQTTVVTNLFPTLVEARFIRIQPTAWNVHISLRFEVLGCQDDEPCVISDMPLDISQTTVPNQATAVVTWTPPTASDNSGAQITLTSYHKSGDTFGIGTHVVTYTGTDPSNNTCSASFTVTITDEEPCAISGMPSDISKATDPNQATAVVTWPPPTASDNSGEQIALTSNYNSGEPFGYGIHEVTYTGKDPSNNECSASFNVTITAPGCFVDSNFIPLGESYISTDCTKKCNCTSANNPDCQSNECDDNEVCEERKNIRKCYCKRGFFLDSKDGKCYGTVNMSYYYTLTMKCVKFERIYANVIAREDSFLIAETENATV